MMSRKHGPTPEQWLQFKPQIRHFYVTEDLSLQDLTDLLQILGLPVTKNQLEYKLKTWKMKKNIDHETWKFIDHTISKRRLQGKNSEVIYCGKLVKQSTVEKETARHRNTSIFAPAPTANEFLLNSTDVPLVVSTPPPLPMRFIWPATLPWLQFRDTLMTWSWRSQKYSSYQQSDISVSPALHTGPVSVLKALGWRSRKDEETWSVSKLTNEFGLMMPEFYPGEHLQTAQLIFVSSEADYMPHCLKMIIYLVSNGITSGSWASHYLDLTYDLLSAAGLLEPAVDLKEIRDRSLTARAFTDNLWREVFISVADAGFPYNNEPSEKALALVKWLLPLCGNVKIMQTCYASDNSFTPLEAAIRTGQSDLVELCFAADFHLALNSSELRRYVNLTMLSKASDAVKLRIIRIFFQRTPCEVEVLLHAAITLRDLDVVKELLELGADPLKGVSPSKNSPLYEENALSAAAGVGKQITLSILEHIIIQHQLMLPSMYVTPDTFIAAALAGNTDVISLLHTISPIGSSPNQHGFTPIQAAVSNGHLSACQLLIELYNETCPSLLFMACHEEHLDILQVLIEKGANVNETIDPEDEWACHLPLRSHIDMFPPMPPMTTLERFFESPFRYWSGLPPTNAFRVMLESGAALPKGAITWLAATLHVEALLIALDGGGSPNEDIGGLSALHNAIMSCRASHRFPKTQRQPEKLATVELLIDRGAMVLEKEILAAITLEDRDLIIVLLRRGLGLVGMFDGSTPAVEKAIETQVVHLLKIATERLSIHYFSGLLCAAIIVGSRQLVDVLLTNRPPQSETSPLEGTAVGLAAKRDDIDLIRKLLAYFHKPSSASLPFRTIDGKLVAYSEVDCWCRRRGTSVEGSPLALAISDKGTDGFSELLQNGYRADILTWVRAAKYPQYLRLLVHHGSRIDGLMSPVLNINPVLNDAVKKQDKELLLTLIQAGADVNERRMPESYSAIQIAAAIGNLDIIDCLMQVGADINSPPSFRGGFTALQIAAIGGYVGLAKHLLHLGARGNARGSRAGGSTALEAAAEHGRLDILQLLLCHGALIDGAGRLQLVRAVYLSEKNGYRTAADLLRHAREWTDEDKSLLRNQSLIEGKVSNSHCCDEIHEPGDDCIHDYTESEEIEFTNRMLENGTWVDFHDISEIDGINVNGVFVSRVRKLSR